MIKIVTDYLDVSAKKYPDKTAFADDNREITFSELRNESRKLAVNIHKNYFNKPVCILMDKTVECVSAMLAVVYSGNFYTVLDSNMPEERIQKILSVLEPEVMVTCNKYLDRAKEIAAKDNSLSEEKIIVYEDTLKTDVDEKELDNVRDKIDVSSTMFVLFTSGSTGVPKGVIITHKPMPEYIGWYVDMFGFSDKTVFANQAPFYFIMSCPEIFSTLAVGATCYIPSKKTFSFPVVLLNYLKEKKVNTIYFVPSVLCMIANFRALPFVHLDDLKQVFFGGEVMPSKQLNMWRKEYPDVAFTNLYGPTETTELVSYYKIEREIDDAESLPVGKPASYVKTMILDENDREITDDRVGELCVTGVCLAEGYYNNPEKTKEVFVPNPLYKDGDDPETKKIYRTGDLVKLDENGDYIFMGRKDFQIKHMGNRIELGEIETAVSSIDGVARNCCLYDTKRSMIVMFYNGEKDEDTIMNELKTMLPDYMLPNRIEKLEDMPVNLNGKIDRAALKQQI